MTDREKKTLKDGVISIFDKFNLHDHTATIGGLRNDILKFINSMQEEPVSEWQKNHLWKLADGDELPEIDREVVAFQEIFPTDVDVPSLLKVVMAHRPNPDGYYGKSIVTGKTEHYTPKTYDKGGWNIPNVKYWLDCQIP